MTDADFTGLANQLHRAIVPVLSDQELKRVADFLRQAYEAGRRSAFAPAQGTIIDVSDGKSRAWLAV